MLSPKFTRVILFCSLVAIFWLADAMASSAVALGSCLVFLVSVALVSRSCYILNFHRVSIPSFWFLSYLAMIFVPSFIVFSDQPGPYRAQYLLAVESVLITVPIGWCLANVLYRFRREEIDLFFELPIEEVVGDSSLKRRCWVLLGICFALTAAYLIEVRTIPLFYLVRNPGDYLELALLREDSFKLLDSPLSYFYYLARGLLYPITILIALGAYLGSRKKYWLVTFFVAAGTGLFYASLSLAKAPVAAIFLLVGMFFYLYRQGHLSKKTIAVVLVLVFLFPVIVITQVYSDVDVGLLTAMGAIGYRLFYLPSEVVYYYFEVFPAHVPYLHGRAIDKLAKLLGVKYFDTSNAVGNFAYMEGIDTVSANGAFIADLNADFGMWGVILGGVLAGLIMQSVQIFLLRRKKTVVTVASFAFLIMAFWYLHSASLPIVLASNGVLLILLIAWYIDRPEAREFALSAG